MYCKLKSGKDEDGDPTSRPYTPISPVERRGSFDLLVKVYFPTDRFPKGGLISQQLNSLKIGDQIQIAVPPSKYTYLGGGRWKVNETNAVKKFKSVSMVAGGSGITPMYQFIQNAITEFDSKNLSLIFANKTANDILLKPELDALSKASKLNLAYTLDVGSDNWKGFVGFVSEKMFKETFPRPSEDHLLIACGPPLMVRDVLKIAKELQYSEDNIFVF